MGASRGMGVMVAAQGLALTCALGACLVPGVARAELIRVPQGTSIQAALDRAAGGDVVELERGVFREHVRIEHRVTLRGTPGAVLDGGGEGTVVTVTAPGAGVVRLAIRGSGSDLAAPDCAIYVAAEAEGARVIGNTITDSAFGIWIHATRGAQVVGNTVRGRSGVRQADRGNGIQLFDGTDLLVRDNEVTGARDGIYVSATEHSLIEGNRVSGQRYGVHYMYSHSNTVRNNRSSHNTTGFGIMESRNLIVTGNIAEDNERHGILFRDAQACEIRDNQLIRNGEGLFFFSSTENRIENNTVAFNTIGARIWAGSVRNRVSHNSFIGNRQQVLYVGAADLEWGQDEPGNFWSDYLGWDQDGDGRGDRPYRVDSFTANLLYRYPSAAVLLRSPVLELLAHLEARLPLLQVPTVVDHAPDMTRHEP